jgi:hypothetical protein
MWRTKRMSSNEDLSDRIFLEVIGNGAVDVPVRGVPDLFQSSGDFSSVWYIAESR